jgi:ubiquinone/menaquinone biosynthesis C-methylase UbiE
MTEWNPSEKHERIAEANRRLYAESAAQYDRTETCVTDRSIQRELERDLDLVLAELGLPANKLRVLDACGGSGNVALKLLRRGATVTLVDISRELQALFQAKCAREQFDATIVNSEIGSFLAKHPREFDLIVFSSALHHLHSIDDVLAMALRALRPGGLLFTTFDPSSRTRMKRITRDLLKLEYVVFKVMNHPFDVPFAALRRVRRSLRRFSKRPVDGTEIDSASVGVLAEYHVETGIDDLALVENLQAIGFQVVWHRRVVECRYAPTRTLIELLGDRTAFKLLLRRPT